VKKTHPRVVAYGDVDEVNSLIGLIRAKLTPELSSLNALLKDIQNTLFVVGGDLATPPDAPFEIRRVSQGEVERLEREIDAYNAQLPPLEEFILPAGHEVASLLHVARAVCRRAERSVVAAMESGEDINPQVQVYLNRLSDLLFVLARWANLKTHTPEEGAHFK